jgi:hypothetical protein
MIQTVESVVDPEGRGQLLGEVHITSPRRALVTVLEGPAAVAGEATLLAEAALAVARTRAGGRRVVAPPTGDVIQKKTNRPARPPLPWPAEPVSFLVRSLSQRRTVR